MFFWMILASLMGVIMFGNLQDKIKDQQDYVSPVYQAIAFSMQEQHAAAHNGYLDAARANPDAVVTYLNSVTDGILPLATVEPNGGQPTMSDGTGSSGLTNPVYPYIQRRLPATYKAQNGTRSFLFCIPRDQKTAANIQCGTDPNLVKYVVTIRQIPRKNDGSDRMSVLEAIAKSTNYSKFIGLLGKSSTPLSSVPQGSAGGQPLGSHFYVLSSGYDVVKSVYIPDHIVCNFPLNDASFPVTNSSQVLGDQNNGMDKHSYAIAVSFLGGDLVAGDNLTDPGSDGTSCYASTHF